MSYCECEYDYDPPAFYYADMVTARKEHRCYECGGPILPGEKYKRKSGKWDCGVETFRECYLCLELREWATISAPCFCCNTFGELHERVREMVEDIGPHVPGFMFEWGRRMVKIKRRRKPAFTSAE